MGPNGVAPNVFSFSGIRDDIEGTPMNLYTELRRAASRAPAPGQGHDRIQRIPWSLRARECHPIRRSQGPEAAFQLLGVQRKRHTCVLLKVRTSICIARTVYYTPLTRCRHWTNRQAGQAPPTACTHRLSAMAQPPPRTASSSKVSTSVTHN